MPKQQIIDFVKQTLGCGCPDKVFEKIECSKLVLQGSGLDVHRIVVGDTLLIYICSDWSLENLDSHLVSIVTTAKNERDSKQYNRFRLVLKIPEKRQQEILQEKFSKASANDEKLHLHFVASAELKKVIEN